MAGRLQDSVVIVTGASRGIGADVARVLAREGAKVVATARTVNEGDFHIPGSLAETIASIDAEGYEAVPFRCDVGNEADVEALAAFAIDHYGRIDAVINNAGIATPGTIESMKWRHLQLAWNINVAAPAQLSRLVLPHFRERGSGGIINISSGASRGPGAGPYAKRAEGGTVYGLTKAALERMTQGMAAELWGTGISVNALSPGKQIFVGGTVYVAEHDPAFQVSNLSGRRKDGTIMGDACLEILTAAPAVFTGRVVTDEEALTQLAGVTNFDHYATF